MNVVTAEEMKKIDQYAITECQIPTLILMENAGIALTEALESDFLLKEKAVIAILSGPGNNGGDGLVMARQLHLRGYQVIVFSINEGKSFSEEYRKNEEILRHFSIKHYRIQKEHQLKILKLQLRQVDVVVDALFGIGINRSLEKIYARAVDICNKTENIVCVSVDIPSGVNGTTGISYGEAIRADVTYMLGYAKIGCYQPQAEPYVGELKVLEIGFPNYLPQRMNCKGSLLDKSILATLLPSRARDSHKGTYGQLLHFTGSVGMSGASVLAMKAAAKAGVGSQRAFLDSEIYMSVAAQVPEAMVYPFRDSFEELFENALNKASAIICGCGFGCGDKQSKILDAILSTSNKPLVLDADALTLLSQEKKLSLLKTYDGEIIITPHPGEAARVLGVTAKEIQSNRLQSALKIASEYQITVVLKGYNTIIAYPDGYYYVNTINTPALATAGSGDVLAGIIGSFFAQGYDSTIAACLGVVTHAKAGCFSEKKYGVRATSAETIAQEIGEVLRQIENGKGRQYV